MERMRVKPGDVVRVMIPGEDRPRLGLVTATDDQVVWCRLERNPRLQERHGRWAPLPVGYELRRIFDV